MARTVIVPAKPWDVYMAAANAAIDRQRSEYIRASAIFCFKRTHFHDTDVRGPEATPRYFTNCCNCGAPREQAECSYCRSVTP